MSGWGYHKYEARQIGLFVVRGLSHSGQLRAPALSAGLVCCELRFSDEVAPGDVQLPRSFSSAMMPSPAVKTRPSIDRVLCFIDHLSVLSAECFGRSKCCFLSASETLSFARVVASWICTL